MSFADIIYRKSLDLPDDKAHEVINFIDFIKSRPILVEKMPVDDQKISSLSLYQAFAEAGLIGCLETDEQFASTYKQKLNFSHKHGKPK